MSYVFDVNTKYNKFACRKFCNPKIECTSMYLIALFYVFNMLAYERLSKVSVLSSKYPKYSAYLPGSACYCIIYICYWYIMKILTALIRLVRFLFFEMFPALFSIDALKYLKRRSWQISWGFKLQSWREAVLLFPDLQFENLSRYFWHNTKHALNFNLKLEKFFQIDAEKVPHINLYIYIKIIYFW